MSDGSNNQSWIIPIVVAIISAISAITVAIISNQTPKPETPKPETSKPETSKPETPKPETSKPETSKPETPKPETPKPETPKPEPSVCIVTITNRLVSLHSDPDVFSRKIIKVEPGEYSVLNHNRNQSWFQIQAEGRTGWIKNDTWTIDKKNIKCP